MLLSSKELAQELVMHLGQAICCHVNRREVHSDVRQQYRNAVTLLFQITEDPWEALQFIQKHGYSYHDH